MSEQPPPNKPPNQRHERKALVHFDGTRIFQTPEQIAKERALADKIGKAYGIQFIHFGALCPVDWFGTRDGRMIGLFEFRGHPFASYKYPTVWLNLRKWFGLSMGSAFMGCPGILIVEFSDGIYWIPMTEVCARITFVGGHSRETAQIESDIEPIIEILSGKMHEIKTFDM